MKRRILSLLLALAVISTMIMAVPMTGYAAEETIKFLITSGETYTAGTQSFDGSDVIGVDFSVSGGNTFKESKKYSFTDTDFTALVEGGSNPLNAASKSPNSSDWIPVSGTFYKFTPQKNGSLKVGYVLNKDKYLFIIKDGTPIDGYGEEGHQAKEKEYSAVTFDVVSGSTYYMYTTGSKLGFAGLVFTPAPTDPTLTITSDTDLTLKPGESSDPITYTTSNFDEDVTVGFEADASGYVSVSDAGVITAGENDGTATVTVTAKDGSGNKDSKTINVTVASISTGDTYTQQSWDDNNIAETCTFLTNDSGSDLTITDDCVYHGTTFDIMGSAVGTKHPSGMNYVVNAVNNPTVSVGGNAIRQVLLVKPSVDGVLTVDLRVLGAAQEDENGDWSGGNKTVKIGELQDDGTYTQVGMLQSPEKENIAPAKVSAPVTAGKTYLVGGQGTNLNVNAVSLAQFSYGDTAIDSGVYTDSTTSETVGVIRFFQAFAGTADDYGFIFVDSNGVLQTKSSIAKDAAATIGEGLGFYGDLYDIPNANLSDTFYAKAYVTIGSDTYYGETINATVAQDVLIDASSIGQ